MVGREFAERPIEDVQKLNRRSGATPPMESRYGPFLALIHEDLAERISPSYGSSTAQQHECASLESSFGVLEAITIQRHAILRPWLF